MTTKPRQRGEAGRIGLIKAGLILGGLMASLIGSQILVGQEIATSQTTTASKGDNGLQVEMAPQVVPGNNVTTFQTMPAPSRQIQFYPITRGRSS